MPTDPSSRRWKKSKSPSNKGEYPTDYVAPSLDDNFVTQPPKPAKGLTGKISTLFRRDSTKDRRSSRRGSEGNVRSRGVDEDEVSIAASISSRNSKRIFYSSNADDDSDDSYESRVSTSRRTRKSEEDYGDYTSQSATDASGATRMILRYRGFSTSIQSLFLDEGLVCASMGCFGLILSNRTEHLLQIRNERRGALSPRRGGADRKKLPSRIVAWGLIVMVLMMFTTFVIWGFGSNASGLAKDYYNGYDYLDEEDDQYNENAWDDYLTRADDSYRYGNRNKNYGGNQANDDNQNAYAWDDYLMNNDDGGANQAQNDDGNVQNDDAAQQNADAQNDDGQNYYQANDDKNMGQYYNYYQNNGGNRRHLEVTARGVLLDDRPKGIFKLRDYQENLWNPIYDFVMDEWYRDDRPTTSHSRRMEDGANQYQSYDDGDYPAAAQLSQQERDMGSVLRIVIFVFFLLFLGVLGRRRRMRTRFYIVRARAQEDHLYYASSDVGEARRVAFEDTREDQYEGACSHTLCGCYPIDENVPDEMDEEDVEVTDSGIFRRKKSPHHEDCIARGFSCIMATCCGLICKRWFQCMSICALAQEAREIRLLVPPRYQRVDYITHQPFHEYQGAVNDLRRGWLGRAKRKLGIMPHFEALSRLSRYIIVMFVVAFSIIVATLCFNPLAAFAWQDAVVLSATFLQSFLLLFIVHGIFHKSDLSLDAAIKFYAAGFLIAVPAVFFFEGFLVNTMLLIVWGVYEGCLAISGEAFEAWVFDHWRMIWIAGELFTAYVVAAITEELCKYYTFRCVEHPDLIFLTGLHRNEHDVKAVDGGLVKYPFASHQVANMARDSSDDASQYSHRSNSSRSRSRSRRSRRSRNSEGLIQRTGTRDDEFEEDEQDVRTHRQKAMAITTAMICVAVGLACAENCVYVFFLGGAMGASSADGGAEQHRGDVLEEWIVLLFRSIFPIHALAAAMQSINMIRKFVEGDNQDGHRIGVGRIIMPAVILHGTFDAILMGINVFIETAWDRYLEENEGKVGDDEPYDALIVNLVAWIGITVVMFAGILWYYRENRAQRLRLILLEEQERAASEAEGWTAPTSPDATQSEIV